jgi:hypothetical protein
MVASALLAMLVGNAVARRFEVSSQFDRAVTPRLVFASGSFSITCSMTAEGSFHSRTISKVCGALVGYVTRAAIGHPCNGGEVWMLNGIETLPGGGTAPNTLPWHGEFLSFTGTLPRITGIKGALVGGSILAEVSGVTCLYRMTQASPGIGIAEIGPEGRVTGGRSDETASIPLAEGGFACPSSGSLGGSGTVTQQGTTTAIFVRLVQ